jgi:hypothetical protein
VPHGVKDAEPAAARAREASSCSFRVLSLPTIRASPRFLITGSPPAGCLFLAANWLATVEPPF